MMTPLAVGSLVEYPDGPGVGRIGELADERVRVDMFDSIARQVAESRWLPAASCSRARLEPETRVYWRNPDTGDWVAGRVKGTSPGGYYVQFPNTEYDFPLPEQDLRVRWDRPVSSPETVLAAGGNESAFYYHARLPLLRNLLEQRASSASTFAFLSSAIEFFPHQINTVLKVLSDPVQRYLLADEVGLGKTIEAGLIIRQTLLDNSHARVAILVPDALRLQWARELCDKFFIDDFPDAQVKCIAHEAPERWAAYSSSDLVVVDEAHRLVQAGDPEKPEYRRLCDLAHSAPRLLLLSATPVMSQHTTQLGLLHLLDPNLYRWTERAAFERRYQLRSQLADAVYGLSSDFTYLLPSAVEGIGVILPASDARFADLGGRVLSMLDDNDELRVGADQAQLHGRVEELKAHISETYRLHRRVIRHRRDKVLRADPDSADMPYEVTGRTAAQRLPVTNAHAIAQQSLLDWQSRAWAALLDGDLAVQGSDYGLALGVMVSRLGGPADDFADALRWRVRRDPDAAERAGLTDREMAMLAAPGLLPTELPVLTELEARLAEGPGDLPNGASGDINALVTAILPGLRSSHRTVIFCGAGSLAGHLAARLRQRFSRIGVYEHIRGGSRDDWDTAVRQWAAPTQPGGNSRVLVTDDTAEDGLNLQVAGAVLHLRLPWSPNQLEQRLGRVDRYADASASAVTPAQQFVISGGDPDESFTDAWADLLQDGYGAFAGSISTLQDAVANGLSSTWRAGMESGPTGLQRRGGEVRAELDAARRDIDKVDMLESIHDFSPDERDITAALVTIEQRWRGTRDALLGYVATGSGGIGLQHHSRTVHGSHREVFDLAQSRPLLSPRLWKLAAHRVKTSMAQGAFNRSAALRAPGTRLLRRGNPLVDVLAEAIAVDDRGQATAIRRVDQRFSGDPEPYFGFDYIVEADITQALGKLKHHPGAAAALRRQADRIMPPFTLKAWIGATGEQPISDPAMWAWLDQPYNKTGGDRNYSRERRDELRNIFGGWASFQASAEAAETRCRRHLAEVTDLRQVCARARDRARQRIAVTTSQARARQAAGHLVGDSESYLLDVAVTDALVEGLSSPAVRVVAATCIVRVPLTRARYGG
jgi:ATP-dependent helicase HepA